MDGFTLYFALLSAFLLYDAQPAAPTGCAGPPVLCCSGQNNSCFRQCYCDEACLQIGDCCDDYISTCTQHLPPALSSTVSSTTERSTTSITTASSDVSTKSASVMSAATATSQDSSSTTSTQLDGLPTSASSVLAATAQPAAPAGCAGPPVLCCSGRNDSCFRQCFCDEECLPFRDCCPDNNTTCTQRE
ncbi:proteoglycan 4-like [Etheostoma cragini]|uniref:proteoglycan 4-like n=1 Tax=Etheostoma cragini TaxID=417921 RepID=UPI00155E602F|nr:proteoglycan 4-like [Etheostoma cragini]